MGHHGTGHVLQSDLAIQVFGVDFAVYMLYDNLTAVHALELQRRVARYSNRKISGPVGRGFDIDDVIFFGHIKARSAWQIETSHTVGARRMPVVRFLVGA